VEYRRLYQGFLDDAPAEPPFVPTLDYILKSSPFIDVSDSEGPTTAQLTTARNHRGGLTGHLVGWHQAEYSSCATATRSRFYLPTPAWWSGVEVPYGCMAELPWVHAYAADDLHAGRRTPWAIFRSEWALEADVVLLETFRNRRVLWRFPPRLLDCIRALGPANICVGPGGLDAEATAILGSLLDLADQLPDTEPSLSASALAAPTAGTARVGSGPALRWKTTRRAPRSPRTLAPSTFHTPRTSWRPVVTATPVGVGPPLSQRRGALATPGLGPSRPLLPR